MPRGVIKTQKWCTGPQLQRLTADGGVLYCVVKLNYCGTFPDLCLCMYFLAALFPKASVSVLSLVSPPSFYFVTLIMIKEAPQRREQPTIISISVSLGDVLFPRGHKLSI